MSKFNLLDLLNSMSEDEKNDLHSDVFRARGGLFVSDSIFPPAYRQTTYTAERPKKGTVDLLSPDGRLLMRDGKLVS